MTCRICENDVRRLFEARCLRKHTIQYFYCDNCGFLQTEKPFWLEEAYREPINETDTGILSRNLYLFNVTSTLITFLFDKKGVFLDYAGGHGILTRLMRDSGFNFYWYDPYTNNMFSRGFEFNENVGKVDLVTCYEAFEHFVQPIAEIDRLLSISSNLLFTTEFLPSPVPLPAEWWYYGLEHGQHISFYSLKTVSYIAKRYGMNLYTDNKFVHLLTKKKINAYAFKAILKMSSLGLGYLTRLFLTSKTISDMDHLISSQSKRDTGQTVG